MKPAALTRQQREQRIADIVAYLRPHKRGVDEMAMMAEIGSIVEMLLRVAAIKPRTAAAKKTAARAAKDLSALEQYLPTFVEFDDGQTAITPFGYVQTLLKGFASGKGPHPHFSYLNWICEYCARALVKKYWSRLATTRDVQQAAQLLRAAATGQPGTTFGLLKSVKQSKK